jgi:hypothetical protein
MSPAKNLHSPLLSKTTVHWPVLRPFRTSTPPSCGRTFFKMLPCGSSPNTDMKRGRQPSLMRASQILRATPPPLITDLPKWMRPSICNESQDQFRHSDPKLSREESRVQQTIRCSPLQVFVRNMVEVPGERLPLHYLDLIGIPRGKDAEIYRFVYDEIILF